VTNFIKQGLEKVEKENIPKHKWNATIAKYLIESGILDASKELVRKHRQRYINKKAGQS
jgi:hypothetical protein